MITTTVFVDNIHCNSCVAQVNSVLSPLVDIVSVDVSEADRKISVIHRKALSSAEIIQTLKGAGFQVRSSNSVEMRAENHQNDDQSSDHTIDRKERSLSPSSSVSTLNSEPDFSAHINYCAVCQAEHNEKGGLSKPSAHTRPLSHGGASLQDAIHNVSPENFDLEAQGHACDRGTPSDPVGSGSDDEFKAEISIGGMTCASCSNSVAAAVKELEFVKDVTVTLLTNSSTVTYTGPSHNIEKIVEAIEDAGFDASLHSTELLPKHNGKSMEDTEDEVSRPVERTLSLKIEGMYCEECPSAVLEALSELDSDQLTVVTPPTYQNPIMTVRYTPNSPSLTVRSIISTISMRRSGFSASVYHPPTVEDRSKAMQERERRNLLRRLLFSIVVAIPTFVIMIVFGTLLPSSNKTRQYFMKPIWNGNATRMEWALFITTTPVMFYGADVFHRHAFKEIMHLWRPGSPVPFWRRLYRFGSMNLLVSAGTCVAYFASLAMLIVHASESRDINGTHHEESYFDTVAFLTMFILAGRSLEAYSKAKTGDAVAQIGKLRPSEALLVVADSNSGQTDIENVPTDLLDIGDTICIPSGGSPAADGLLQSTEASPFLFDESSLTGESKPVPKFNGDKIFSGSVNIDPRTARITITDIGGTSLLDQIVNVMREGQMKRAPVEHIADVITAYFIPVITLIAVLVFVIWLSLGVSGSLPRDYLGSGSHEGGWAFWALKFAIAVFVVACPCGLALAAPTALFVGIGIAAKQGILVRGGGEAFQEATRLDTVIFDKTGTLTEGNGMNVSDCEEIVEDEDLLEVSWVLANALEQTSTHPKAKAICRYTKDKVSSRVNVKSSSITEVPGKGIRGTFEISLQSDDDATASQKCETYEASLGSRNLLEGADEINPTLQTRLNSSMLRHEGDGTTTAVLFLHRLSGPQTSPAPALLFAFSDPIRAEAEQVISYLQSRNIEVYMCTGDNISTAKGVARKLNIPSAHVVANVDPVKKAEFTGQIQRGEFVQSLNNDQNQHLEDMPSSRKKVVAFVGDGTNDSGALASADVGIAMSSGSDVALSAASFILLHCDLHGVLELCSISRRVINRVKYNFGWAAVYNLCLVPVAAGVFYPIVSGKQEIDGVVMNKHWRLDPAWASLAMALSSVSVVCSSLALRVEVRKSLRRLMFWRK
ncbi:copper-sulfate regulated protein 1 [Ascosphaera apis ARSEF 7405]|uniref:Copper-sulfate regulated protein 1 n=1 Tax=Ascosphaera apis ARSEF 7405 TaxID=392613 RepID=A0A166P1W5_9EURO|nr:copper-sulfate regulated protein 1 [Ascosphaera apis ARSEF 7405]